MPGKPGDDVSETARGGQKGIYVVEGHTESPASPRARSGLARPRGGVEGSDASAEDMHSKGPEQ